MIDSTDPDCWACARSVTHAHDHSDWSGCPHWPTTPGEVAGCCVAAASADLDALAGRAALRRALAAGVPDRPPAVFDSTEVELRALFDHEDPVRTVWFNEGPPVERDADAPSPPRPVDAPWTWCYPDGDGGAVA